ncbi:MAG: proprotein convertase P-domain-containing protein [Gammaproteobacteria bacterium]
MKIVKLISAIVIAGIFSAGVAAADVSERKATTNMSSKELASSCAMLDDMKKRPLMDGLLNRLLVLCGRTSEFGGVESEKYDPDHNVNRIPGTDVEVNDDAGETGNTQTQNETSLAISGTTGTICSGYNDSYSGVTVGGGFTGFSRSTDGGNTFTDNAAFDANSFGDPSMIWREADGNFYLATLHSDGLGVYVSSDDCQTFTLGSLGHVGTGDDKELLAVDNNLGSDFYGRIHLVWVDFSAGGRIYATYSDDAINWSTPVVLSDAGATVQGAYPIISNDGRLYVSWIRFNPFPFGNIDIEAVRSDDGGDSFTDLANPLTDALSPFQTAASNSCGRPALNGNIRYLGSPQVAVTPNGDLHIVYSYDPDGRDVGDVVDVFYRRSTDMGATWLPEIRVHDDATLTDQFFPSLSAGPTGRIVVAWYDRRFDTDNNLFVDYFAVMSEDGGASFGPNERISDVSSPIFIDPGLAACYHGDYDQQLQTASSAFLQWADDRVLGGAGPNDSNVYLDENIFEPDFFLTGTNTVAAVCAPDSADFDIQVGEALGFSDPVTLSASGVPAGMTSAFSTNPVIPAGSSTLTISNTAAGPAGTYNIDVTGISGSKSRATQLVLTVATATPGVAALAAPVNGATEQASSPTFSWASSSQAATYTIEIATDAGFANVVASDQVSGTSYTLPSSLAPQTTYFWRVTADNVCGESTPSATFSFTTQNIICVVADVALPDNPAPATTSQTLVGSGGELTDLNVTINAAHTYVGDLTFTLTHEDTGTAVIIIDRPGRIDAGFGCSGNDIDATLDDDGLLPVEDQCDNAPALSGILSPNNPLSAFNGEDLAGTWTLSVLDGAGGDTGTLNEWCLVPALVDVVVDSDGDGVGDDVDNCTNVANASQLDSNGDGFGNACDADTNNDCIINFLDVSAFTEVFNTMDADNDFNGDGNVNFLDYVILTGQFTQVPGPSALASCETN